MAAPTYAALEAKSGLTRGTLAEPFLTSLYRSLAPYRGCGHGCAYCDGRAEKYYVEGIFDRDIGARFNLPERIRMDIERGVAAREYGAVCVGSGVTDVYQPYDGRFALMRETLEALLPSRLPIVILTKNARIMRDFDLLARFPKALVIFTVTTLDPAKASALEPGASPPERRLEAIRAARAAGFHAGVMAMPLCPGITDEPDEATALFAACRDAGAEFVYPGGLTLRPGRQKEHFEALVAREWPALSPLYRDVYAENRQSGAPKATYRRGLERQILKTLDDMNIPAMIPHGVYREILALPDALFVLLAHMQSLYGARGVDVRALKAATERYASWLTAERAPLRRKKSLADIDTPFPVTAILERRLRERPFAEICGNDRLGKLMDGIIRDGHVFDYPTLRVNTEEVKSNP